MTKGAAITDFYVAPEGTVAKDLNSYDSYNNERIPNRGYKPQPGERTLEGYGKIMFR